MGEAKRKKQFGATDDFPRGKLNSDDEGGLQFGIAIKDKTVILDFGKPVAWLGMDKATAMQLGALLIDKARQL